MQRLDTLVVGAYLRGVLRSASVCAALILFATFAQAQGPRDSAVVTVLKRADASLVHTRVWRRVQVADELDLVLALGSPKTWPFEQRFAESDWWGVQRKLGLFLQERTDPSRVFTLTIGQGIDGCDSARIVRATATDTVIACEAEKFETLQNQKFVYDVRAKRLVRRFSYDPFFHNRIRSKGADGARLTVANDKYEATFDFALKRTPAFQITGRTERTPRTDKEGSAIPPPPRGPRINPLSPRFGLSGAFRLAWISGSNDQALEHSDCPADGSEHPVVVETRGSRESRHRVPRKEPDCHAIGPWQLERNLLWFGTTYYAGEGQTGVGGFGYFDAVAREFRLIPSPELEDWSTSAILVQPEAVWLALISRGEYGNGTGGVVRYDRAAKTFRRFDIGPGVGQQFLIVGDHLLVATEKGVVIIRGEEISGYFVDQTTDGRLRVVEGFR